MFGLLSIIIVRLGGGGRGGGGGLKKSENELIFQPWETTEKKQTNKQH